MTFDNSGFHRQVAIEMDRMYRQGYSPEHDDEHGLDHLLSRAFGYIVDGHTVKAAAMITAARAYLQRNSKNTMQVAIEKFMKACGQEVKIYPGIPDEKVKQLRIKLMVEELLGAKEVPEGVDNEWGLIQNKSDELVKSILNNDLVGIADGIADVLYVVIGTAAAFGIDIQEVFDEVQRSNMTKAVWDETIEEYVVIRNEHGKVLKPDTFSEAQLAPIIQNQIARGEAFELAMKEFMESDKEEMVIND